MRRKIAFGLTIAMIVLLTVLRPEMIPALESLSLFGMNIHTIAIALVGVTLVADIALCFTKQTPTMEPSGKWAVTCGWMATFCGAVLTMTVLLDFFFWRFYGEVPAPGAYLEGPLDHTLLTCMILFGIAGGIYLVMQGFQWMSDKAESPAWLRWLSLCPVLWMWFRLARYEISYASTLDIDESFFDFATLVFASLFFLQFARTIAHVGKPPKTGLLVLSLITALVSLSSTPTALVNMAVGKPVSSMMIVIVDAVIGLTALFYAAMQVFSPMQNALPAEAEAVADETEDAQTESLSWDVSQTEPAPVEPPFSMDKKLPMLDALPVEPARYPRPQKAEPAPAESESTETANPTEPTPIPASVPTVDELLSELENF